MATCSDCGSEIRAGARFCDACGARLSTDVGGADLQLAQTFEEEAPAAPTNEGEGHVESMFSEDFDSSDSPGEPEADSQESEAEAPPDWPDAEDEGLTGTAEPEEELAPEPPKAGYLVFPDNTEQAISPSQWLIGRTDLAKFLPDPKKANEISRGHLTVFQEGDRFFIEDGTTMVQRKASTNKTWLVRGSSRILVTGTGRNELQDADEIDVAELVKLQFVMK